MPDSQIYEDDLSNRFPTYTFNTTVDGSLTTYDALDGATLMQTATKASLDDAVFQVRQGLVGGLEVLPLLDTSQRDALTGITEGTCLLNSDTTNIERFENSSWVPTNLVLDGDYTFQGDTKFGGDSSIAPLGRISVIGSDLDSGRVRTLIYSTTATHGAAYQAGHSRGSEDTPAALNSGDRLGQFIFVGDNGSVPAANGPVMRGFTTEAWTGSARGSRIDFLTILDGTTSHNLAFRLSENGYPEAPEYTVATLPSVGSGGGFIAVTDETGGYTMAFSDGSNWRRVQDRTIVA